MNDLAPAGITPAFVPRPREGREIEGSRHELTKVYRRAKYYWVATLKERCIRGDIRRIRIPPSVISVAYAPSGLSDVSFLSSAFFSWGIRAPRKTEIKKFRIRAYMYIYIYINK